jgi:hypothetical protein
MVQPAESRNRHDRAELTSLLWLPSGWRLLLEAQVRTVFVIEGNVVSKQSSEMTFIEHDDVVEQLSYAADPALGDVVLPRGCDTLSGLVRCRTTSTSQQPVLKESSRDRR